MKIVKMPKEVLEKAKIVGNIFEDKKKLILALEAIENLVNDDFVQDMEMALYEKKLKGDAKEMAERLNKIYRISHSYNPNHSCYNVHNNWRDEIIQ